MNLKEVKKYVGDTIESYFKPKVLKKFNETNSGVLTYDGDPAIGLLSISKRNDNAVELLEDTTTTSNSGLYVKDLSEEVNKINIAQKTVNEDMDYIQLSTSNQQVSLSQGDVIKFQNARVVHNMEFDTTTGYIKLEAHKSYCLRARLGLYSYSYIAYQFKDMTNNVKIGTAGLNMYKNNRDASDDTGSFAVAYITPSTDIDVALVVHDGTGTFDIQYTSSLEAYEIGRVVTVDPMNYIDTKQGIQDTPVGHIMSIMGNNAPEHYLKCDGTIYNKDDYPHLWEYFKKEFGTPNKFGGNGTTTFAVPDLQGEFLRGTGANSHTNQGNGADVGVHQDGTEMPFVYTWGNTLGMLVSSNNPSAFNGNPTKFDSSVKAEIGYQQGGVSFATQTSSNPATFTTRPTNTSVLWVIKYEPTYFVGSINGKEEITDLTNGFIDLTNSNPQNITLNESIENFDRIEITGEVTYKSSGTRLGLTNWYYNVSDLKERYNNSDNWQNGNQLNYGNIIVEGNIGYILSLFKTENQLFLDCRFLELSSVITKMHVRVRGIKSIYAPDKAIGGGTGTAEPEPTDAEIQTAITETITELNK